jgi:hypothetical protein
MWSASVRSIHYVDVEGHRPRVFLLRPMDFLQFIGISFLQNTEQIRIYNKLCVTLKIVTY